MADLSARQWREVEELFDMATGIAEDRRAEFLARACAKDDAVRCEVESLLAADRSADGFLETTAQTPNDGPDEYEEIDRFRIMRRLGAGGMGVVYLARRTGDGFEQQVAIKVLKRGLDTEDFVRRFKVERQALASLQHPNIARLIDGGTTQDGRPYVALEYVEGVPIDRFCRERNLDVRQRLDLVARVCDAVAHAHGALIVHRDLKPGNILVDAAGEPKLLDFGVAKILRPDVVAETVAVTAPGERLMTLRYASPEQIRGDAITTATDVYALGVILYELLAGASPHGPDATSRRDIERAVLETRPPQPSDVVVNQPRDRRQLRGDVDTIVLTALRKEARRRYPSAEALGHDLRRALRHEPIVARPDTWAYRSGRFMRRHRVPAALTVALFVALVAGLAVSITLYRDSEQARWEARRSESDARFEALVGNLAAASVEVDRSRSAPAISRLESVDEASREWCWQHLFARTNQSIHQLEFELGLSSITPVEDGRTLVVGTIDSRALFVDRASGAILADVALGEGGRDVPLAQLRDDGRVVAIACRRGTVSLIDVDARAEVARVDCGFGRLEDFALSSDGSLLAVAGAAGLRVFRGPDWSEVTELRLDFESLAVRFLPGESTLALATTDSVVRLVDLSGGAVRDVLPVRGHRFEVTDAGALVLADPDGYLQIQTPGGELIRTHLAFGNIVSLCVLPELDAVAVGSSDGVVRLADLRTGGEIAAFTGHWQAPRGLAWDAEARILMSVANDRKILFWDVSPHGLAPSLLESRAGLRRFALSPSGARVAIIEADERVLIVDPDARETLASIPCAAAVDVAYAEGGRRLLVSGESGVVHVYDADTARRIDTIEVAPDIEGDGGFMAIGHRSDGSSLVAVTRGSSAFVVDLTTGEQVAACRGHAESIRDVAIDDGAEQLATVARDGEARVWSVRTGACLHVLNGHSSAALAVAFRPGVNELVTGAFDRSVRIWDLDTERERARLGQRGTVLALGIDSRGSRIVAGATTVDLAIWDAERGQEILALPFTKFVYPRGFAFTADGADLYGSISVPLTNGEWRDSFRVWSTRSMAERYALRRSISSARAAAGDVIDRLWREHASPELVAEAIHAEADLEPGLRRAALNELLRRCDEATTPPP